MILLPFWVPTPFPHWVITTPLHCTKLISCSFPAMSGATAGQRVALTMWLQFTFLSVHANVGATNCPLQTYIKRYVLMCLCGYVCVALHKQFLCSTECCHYPNVCLTVYTAASAAHFYRSKLRKLCVYSYIYI